MRIFINKFIYAITAIGIVCFFGSAGAMQRVTEVGKCIQKTTTSLFKTNVAQNISIMRQLERSRQLTGLKTGDALLQRNGGAYSSLFSSSVNLHESWQRNFASKSKPEILKKYEGLNKKVEIEIYKLLVGAVGLGLAWNLYSYIKNTSQDVIEVRQTVHAIEKMLKHDELSEQDVEKLKEMLKAYAKNSNEVHQKIEQTKTA
jgi:hypothetical protein